LRLAKKEYTYLENAIAFFGGVIQTIPDLGFTHKELFAACKEFFIRKVLLQTILRFCPYDFQECLLFSDRSL
jgi:hypothetical protein